MSKRTQFKHRKKISGADAVVTSAIVEREHYGIEKSAADLPAPESVSSNDVAACTPGTIRPEIDVALSMEVLRRRVGRQSAGDRQVGEIDALIGGRVCQSLDGLLALANEDFIEMAFSVILQREVDNRAFYYYMRQLDDHRSRLDVLDELMASGEAAEQATVGKKAKIVARQHDLLRVQIEGQRTAAQVSTEVPEVPEVTASGESPLQLSVCGVSDRLQGVAAIDGIHGAPIRAEIDMVAALTSIRERLSARPLPLKIRGEGQRPAGAAIGKLLKPADMPQVHFPGVGRALEARPVFRVEEFLYGTETAFIERAYVALLGRKPDQSGEEYYLRKLSGGSPRIEVLASIVASEEAKHRRVVVLGMTWRRWVGRFSKWPVIGHVSRQFADRTSPDFVHVQSLKSFHDEEFVHRAYRSILGRAPDPSGSERYLRALRKGESKIRLIQDIRRSKEGQRRGVRIGGLRTAALWEAAADSPLFGAFAVFGASLFKTSAWRREARYREARTEHFFASLNRNATVAQQTVNSGFSALKDAIDDVAHQVSALSGAHLTNDMQANLLVLAQRVATVEAQSNMLRDSLIDVTKCVEADRG